MLELETKLEGKSSYFGLVRDCISEIGYHIGGNWDYHKGYFDHILCSEEGERIYVRIPFRVLDGELDQDEAYIRFEKPYIIKHVVHIGLDRDGSSLIDATGFSQFQPPLDKDGQIKDKSRWMHAGEVAVQQLVDCLCEANHIKSDIA
ncbi:YugN family protein [Sporosarcina sp. CAU 1771]